MKKVLVFVQSGLFFAASHGKFAGNGIRSRVKRSKALESLK